MKFMRFLIGSFSCLLSSVGAFHKKSIRSIPVSKGETITQIAAHNIKSSAIYELNPDARKG
jgi:hypothetical protein